MVDAVISCVLKKIGEYLIQEAVSLKDRKKDVEWLKNELEWMQYLIKDAEEKQVNDAMIRKWILDVNDIAYDVDDVLDTYMLKANTLQVAEEEGILETTPGVFTSFVSCASNPQSSHRKTNLFNKFKRKIHLYNIGKEIGALKERINDLSHRRERYGIQKVDNNQERKSSTGPYRLRQVRRSASYVVEEHVVGFEDETNYLLAKLLDKEVRRRFVISIFGMGGLGKTTLAKRLYHDYQVKNTFARSAWVSVSHDYSIRDLFLRIIESFKFKTKEEMKDIEKMDEQKLERELHESLQGHRYLVVLDDVWQKEAWQILTRAFPENMNHSRVLITTRIKEVAERSDDKTHVHQLRFLTPNESWELFCYKAVQDSNVDEGLEKVGREMVTKCGGLPLAIVVLGGLLSTKQPHQWDAIHDHIWRYLENDSIQISDILAISFNDLSYQLKLCFLYLGLFPEDYEINIEKLILLLVAEGFIPEEGDQIMEDVAGNYLNKLIDRSLLQIDKRCWGTIITCRIHDLLRDLAIEKAKDLNFFYICDEIRHSSTSSSIISSCRRQAIYSESERAFWFQYCNQRSRSLLFFQRSKEFRSVWCSKFRFLRVLDVDVYRNGLPKEIGKLIHLVYLALKSLYDGNIPPSIGNLQRLQTLQIGHIQDHVTLPTEISKLQELKHLIGFFQGNLPIANSKNLLTLKYVCLPSWVKLNPERLLNLRELQIEVGDPTKKPAFSLDSVAKLRNLRLLSVWLGVDQSFSLQSLSHCPCLVDLRLNGKIEKLPSDMDKILPKLEGLRLMNSLLKDDSIPSLEKLPNLRFLVLGSKSYIEEKLIFSAKGFPRLEVLQFDRCNFLKEWIVGENAMPMLRGLHFKQCYVDVVIPERLRSIPLPGMWECVDRLRGHLSLKLH